MPAEEETPLNMAAVVNPDAAAAAGVTSDVPADIVAAAPAAVVDGKDWSKGALIIVGNHSIPSGDKRPVIIVEESSDPKNGDDGYLAEGGAPVTKTDKYPTKGDLYVRISPEVNFPDGATVITVGEDVQQLSPWGFSPDIRHVCTGPHPAFAAANIAYSRGARDIEIVGLSQFYKDRMQPFVDDLPTNKIIPAPDAKITLT